ncbi:sterol desaturase family protein [Pseudomonas guineae]|uniref:sterol desaturase family protein n=1 Tax=Pseudomonas guineae TaxID=425504 RepID=UPI00142DDF94|nr:hypothetical protein [Pseudomonas guineae]
MLLIGGFGCGPRAAHVGRLGWLEQVLITPSHHRVHHGQIDCYIDKNYSGGFVF